MTARAGARFLAAATVALSASVARAQSPALSPREKALHALSRLGYGPRPGDLDKVAREGADAWISRQLSPETLPDAACAEADKAFPAVSMTARELYQAYPNQAKKKLFGLIGKETQPPREIALQMGAAKLTRAVVCEAQLKEVLSDFWFNHFNVSAKKNAVKWLVSPYEREVIRPRVFGRFRDLLGAVAHSPAMLVYLDNSQSTIDARYAPPGAKDDIDEMEAKMAAGKNKGRKRLGLNENYARELMELHTLGVDGGYTQKDVTELARILTGWTLKQPNAKNKEDDEEFVFRSKMHDPGGKILLGTPFAWSGESEGERALDLLARAPATARFIALKLCRRFVADDPPEALVARVAEAFRSSDGDLRATYRALFTAPEFWERRWLRAKVKSPFEFEVSALRATGAELRDARKAARALEGMGQPLYDCEPPTGWPEKGASWVSAGALLVRLKAAAALFRAGPNAPAAADARAPLAGADPGTPAALDAYVASYLGGVIGERTRSSILARVDHPGVRGPRASPETLAALVLGSPDFQRR